MTAPTIPQDPVVTELLAQEQLSLATCGDGGEPHCATLYFAAGSDLRLYFFSHAESQHACDLAMDPRAAVSISAVAQAWQDIHGLQLRGEARPVAGGAEAKHAWDLYRAKFPFVAELEAEVRRNTLYVFSPRWMRLVDNRRGFGYKMEWTLA